MYTYIPETDFCQNDKLKKKQEERLNWFKGRQPVKTSLQNTFTNRRKGVSNFTVHFLVENTKAKEITEYIPKKLKKVI